MCRPLADWILNKDIKLLTNKQLHTVNYWTSVYTRSFDWETYHVEIQCLIQSLKEIRRNTGWKITLDHIVPLNSPIVSGLHVPWNFQLLHHDVNIYKSNHIWPDHPNEPMDLFE